MLLSANMFDGAVERLSATPKCDIGGQRREPRVVLDTRLTIIPCPEGFDGPHAPPLAIPVRDLSRGGLRFLLPRRLPLDTQFITLLPRQPDANSATPAGEPVLAVLTAVAYWQPLARDLFALGGQFTRVLSDLRLPAAAPRIVLPGLAGNEPNLVPTMGVIERAAS